jgi:hypothetical protein
MGSVESHGTCLRNASFTLLWISSFLAVAINGQTSPSYVGDVSITFERHPAKSILSNASVGLRLRSCDHCIDCDSRFREEIVRQAAQGPNFAAHFTIVKLSCGSGCVSIEVVDAKTEQTLNRMPFFPLFVDFSLMDKESLGLSYRLDSRPFIAAGCFDSTNGDGRGYCGRA